MLTRVVIRNQSFCITSTFHSFSGGIAACGAFLLLISIVGLIGAVRHHQVMLFFYMIILFGIFIVQFSVACACLAVGTEKELEYAKKVRGRGHFLAAVAKKR